MEGKPPLSGSLSGPGRKSRRRHRRFSSDSSILPDAMEPDLAKSRRRKRKLYDPRRYYKGTYKSTNSEVIGTGSPPAGYLLAWLGHFKRWQKRWFVARTPGVLVYHKRGEHKSRSGNIDLQGATVVATGGKERQFMVVTSSGVRYFRATTRQTRDQWVEYLQKSVQTFKEMRAKAVRGPSFGASMMTRQITFSPSSAVKDGWQEREHQLEARMQETMEEIEDERKEFVSQLHTLQKSFFGLASSLSLGPPPSSTPLSKFLTPPTQRPPFATHLSTARSDLSTSSYVNNNTLNSPPPSDGPDDPTFLPSGASSPGRDPLLPKHHSRNRSIFWWKGEGGKRKGSSRSASPAKMLESRLYKAHSDSGVLGPSFLSDSALDDRFLSETNASDPEDRNNNSNFRSNFEAGIEQGRASSVEAEKGSVVSSDPLISTPKEKEDRPESLVGMGQGALQQAWERLQEAHHQVLREEINRVLDLEAENSILQQSFTDLPRLQTESRELHSLKARLKERGTALMSDRELVGGESSSSDQGDSEEDDDSDLRESVPDGDEEYFEALEVLNQHEFLIRSSDSLLADASTEPPPEEGEATEGLETEVDDDVAGAPYRLRTRLPAPRPLSRGFSLWTVLKNAIGKDLNRITLPATINEPLSVLQRAAEELQYKELLDLAVPCSSSLERLLYISAFAISAYQGSVFRDAKPFNPLLGETYEWQSPDEKVRFLAEQVSHHPPITAVHAEHIDNQYVVYGETEIRNKFWGKSVEVVPTGTVNVKIPKYGDHFIWNKVTTCVHNVVVGRLWIDNYGEIFISNKSTGEHAKIKFLKATGGVQGRIQGRVFDAQGQMHWTLFGNYLESVFAAPVPPATPSQICLWKANANPENFAQQYSFTKLAITLNDLPPQLADGLPPTDSRFRPDQRALEEGDLEKATPEKLRLEEKQRETRRLMKQQGQDWRVMWFTHRVPGKWQVGTVADGAEDTSWEFTGEYWKAREKRDWQGCPDIM